MNTRVDPGPLAATGGLVEAAGIAVTVPPPDLLARLKGERVAILDDVSLTVAPGETVGLVGESGSGKTTLARALVGLARRSAGRIAFEGREIGRRDAAGWRHVRRQVAFMHQDAAGALSPRLTVGTLLTEPFAIHGLPLADRRAQAADLLAMVGLPADFARRYPHELSGGQARRVGMARALALRPRLVIADEPTAGLDMSVQGAVLNLLGELKARFGLAYLIVTHNLAAVRHVADRLVILHLGRVVEEGPSGAVFKRPAHPYSAALIAAEPIPDPRRRGLPPPLPGEPPSLLRRPAGCEFQGRCAFATEICRRQPPPLAARGEGRRVRCHHPLS